jgi:quercetin dioxygenase-like cupin family protein
MHRISAMEPKLMRVGEPGQRLSDPDGLQMTLVDTPSASEGRRLEMEWLVPPGRRLAAAEHLHPDGPEVWTLLEGSAGYLLEGEDRTAKAPYEYTVPANTSHAHAWNAGDEPLRMRQLIAPDRPMPELTGGVQGFFETLFAFAQEGKVNDRGDIGGRLQNVLSIYTLLVPGTFLAGPPRWTQRGLLGGLAALARSTGKSAYREPRFDPA